jgi:cytochrome P450
MLLNLVVRGGLTLILLWAARCIYRLTLHPLAGIPGPKLAAMTTAYAMSWDLSKDDSYIKNFPEWHRKYGRIIRIAPNHVHILDIDTYNQVFKIGTKFYRDPAVYSFPFTRGGFFNKLHVKDAKPHRDLYMHYFSRNSLQRLEPTVRENLAELLQRIDDTTTKGRPIDAKRAFRSWTADTVMRYMYDQSFGAVDFPGFKQPMLETMDKYFRNAPLGWYLPRAVNTLVEIIDRIPRAWVMDEGIAASLYVLDRSEEYIEALKRQNKAERTMSIFETALDPKPEKGHPVLSVRSLASDALAFFTAGTDTTANALVTGTWHLLHNRAVLDNLQSELRSAIPHTTDLTSMPLELVALESLPHLRSVIKESLRLSYGVPGRIPRVVPPEGATLCGKPIPGGTIISMSCHSYHHNPAYFSSPDQFLPERWANTHRAAELDKYWIPFSRGSRNCIGQNLAMAELYYAFAYLYRRFELEVFETTSKDMEWKDAFVVVTNGHLQVKAKRLQH